ncbi:hypothetical protein [Clostridium sp. AF34-13]|uniref:hypothetical protein n=1 Tax=Clostridium sp. AF34-13 TaxID=2293012 RepID=UPI0015FA9B09|nr:hypothetical protein [Clostridium sp. AF34-13]
MTKRKPRWKDLSFEDRIEKQLVRAGLSKENASKWKDTYKKRHTKQNNATAKAVMRINT